MPHAEFLVIVRQSLLRVLLAVGAILALLALCAAYARFVEPTWLRVRRVKLSPSPTVRVIHISDIHFKGDTRYLAKVVAAINGLDADLVCFTGDLVEDAAFLDGALRCLSEVNKPLYGVPGNHDLWALRSFNAVQDAFRKTGGDWLSNDSISIPSKRLVLMTLAGCQKQTPPGYKRILLEHYPDDTEQVRGVRFDLILSGHTHGGQVSIPLLGKCVLPFDVGKHARGLFRTPCGPLYVNPGIGTFYLNVRFLCRPEVTVIEM